MHDRWTAAEIDVELENWYGLSAYEIAVKNGYHGTEAEWLESLKGRDGGTKSVNGIEHDPEGNITLTAADIQTSTGKTLEEIATIVEKLNNAVTIANGAINFKNQYIDDALFR